MLKWLFVDGTGVQRWCFFFSLQPLPNNGTSGHLGCSLVTKEKDKGIEDEYEERKKVRELMKQKEQER